LAGMSVSSPTNWPNSAGRLRITASKIPRNLVSGVEEHVGVEAEVAVCYWRARSRSQFPFSLGLGLTGPGARCRIQPLAVSRK
jgi:hypothetical protein